MPSDNILVLGATGATGLAFLHEVLGAESGPRLTLLVRNKGKLPEDLLQRDPSRVRVVEGGLANENKLDEAMEGVTAVVSFLGAYMSLYYLITRSTPTPIADSFHLIKKVMRKHGVKRLLALSTPAHALPGEVYTWTQYITTQILPPAIVPQGSAEMTAIAEVCADPEFDYTIFRVPHLNTGSADSKVYAGRYGADFKGTQELSRASLARWVWREIEQNTWIKDQPALGNY
ncbi:hypothetical protein IAR55_005985 [Kwoniella newhampshirensis]|uniref:NAD(P)-binding domain-containing protein n=1 Tax=Kwoniella newhampshirensis TaxID=1651941 RepID=A0AAW0YV33_9TREE